MPTKKRREIIVPDNLPALTTPEDTCPALYTGSKLAQEDPQRYGRIVQQLAEGKPLTRITKSEKVSFDTVTAILKREGKTVDAVQKMTAGLTSYASQACLMSIIAKLEKDEIPAGVLPICFGILRDKERQDLGQATQTIEVKRTLTIEEVKRELAEMKREAVEAVVE